jgi:hypothetical protein
MVVKKMAGTPVPPVSVFTGASTLISTNYGKYLLCVVACFFKVQDIVFWK